MKALVYEGPGRKSLKERAVPQLDAPTDAIVKVTKTTICGTDLHILKGDVPTCTPGRILGHEGVGVVEDVGVGVRSGKIDPSKVITHRFKLDQILDAYETFGSAAKTHALKVIIETE